MYTYWKIQQAPITDNITVDGHVGARLPWPVIADREGRVHGGLLMGLRGVIGFQRDLAVQQVALWWDEAIVDPQQTVGMYMVIYTVEGKTAVQLSAVDSVEVIEMAEPLSLD